MRPAPYAFSASCTLIIARAEHALAFWHRTRAARAWSDAQLDRLGAELEAAARHTENAAQCIDGGRHAAVCAALSSVRVTAKKIAEGAQCTPETIDKALLILGDALKAIKG